MTSAAQALSSNKIIPNKINRERIVCFFLIFLSAAAPLLVCSKSSPLYPFNDWTDVNMYFTLGKGLVRGQIPYVDLAEQKGPYLFVVSGIGYLLSHKSFYGYFLFEVLSMFLLLWYSHRILLLYVKKSCIWVLPLLSTGITASESFVHGGSLEELTLGLFAYGFYSLLFFLKDEKQADMPVRTLIVNGLLAGVLLWSKFTLLGFYIVWMLVVMWVYLGRKRYGKCFQSAGIFLLAMACTTLPWLVYFGCHNAVGVWLKTYLWDNIFGYAAGGGSGIFSRLGVALLNAFRSLKEPKNIRYGILVMAGGAVYLALPGRLVSLREKLAAAGLGLGMALGIFIGVTKHDYYGLPMAAFGVLGLLALGLAVDRLGSRMVRKGPKMPAEDAVQGDRPGAQTERKSRRMPLLSCIAMMILLVLGIWQAYRVSPNTYLLGMEREEMPQFRFAELIQDAEDTTLLNYGFLDGGFYTVLDQTPTVLYYCTLNVNYEEALAVQNGYVEQELTHFLVTWKAYKAEEEELNSLPVVSEHYELLDYIYFPYEGEYRTYALYELKP